MPRRLTVLLLLPVLLLVTSCDDNLRFQGRIKPYEPNSFFADGQSARPLLDHTVSRTGVQTDPAFYTGKVGNQEVDTIPIQVTHDVLVRGQQEFNIYCSPCHSELGDGNGMIVQRGFMHPPTFHQDRLRNAPIGHFYVVISNGFGTMYSYADRVAPEDRWAIAAYIRALQLSQNAPLQDIPPDQRQTLQGAGQ